MDIDRSKYLYGVFPEILYTVDRNANISWRLNNKMNYYNLMLVYDGKVQFTRNEITFEATRGDLVFYKPGDLRTAVTFPDNLMKSYAVDFVYTCPVYIKGSWKMITPELPFTNVQRIGDEHLFSKLCDLFTLLTRSYLSSKSRSNVKERSIFSEILTLLFQYNEGHQYSYSSVRKVDKIISYMTENYSQNITLHQLSEYAQISPSYLGNIFKKITGKSTIDYLIDIRINKAKSLLRDGFSVSETSKLVGFNDIFYFSRSFKKHEGTSPSQYMNQYYGES
jgi:AraC-like DNA-binding protein